MSQQRLLTQGRLFPTLLHFSLPFLLSNLLQACYGASDLFMVGRFSDSTCVSAVATGSQVMQTITGLCIGLTAGGTVLIGRYFGARQMQNIPHVIKTMTALFGLFSLLLTAGTALFLPAICTIMRVPTEALASTMQYLFICSFGIVFIVGYNVISGILRGLGNSLTPLILIATACLMNIVTDYLFVGKLRWGAAGAAVSTVMAQAVSLTLAFLYLAYKGFLKKYRRGSPCFRLYTAKELLKAGLPIAAQEGLVNLSFLMITAMVNSLGLIASASVGVVEKLIAFSMLPATAYSAALTAMTAQHYGAKLMRRAKQALVLAIFLSLFFGAGFFLLAQCKASSLIGWFSIQPDVMEQGSLYLRSYSADCILVSFVFCMNAYFTGSGHPVFPLIHSLLSTFAVRVPLSYFLVHTPHSSLFTIGLAAPAATLFSLVLCLFFFARGNKKMAQPSLSGLCRVP